VNLQCQDIDELLVDFLYHELEEPRAKAFQAHVDGCARCGAELSSLARMRQALHALPEAEPSPAVSARLLHEAARRAPKPAEQERGGVLAWIRGFFAPLARHPAWAGGIASVVVVAGLAGMLTFSRKVPLDTAASRSVEHVATPEPAPAYPPPAAAAPSPPPQNDETVKAGLKEAPAAVPAVAEDKPAAQPKAGKLERVGRTTTPAEEGTIRGRPEKKKAAGPSFDAPADGLKAGEKQRDLDLGRATETAPAKDFNNAPLNDDRKRQGAGAPAGSDVSGNERAKSAAPPPAAAGEASRAPADAEYRAEPAKELSKESAPVAKPSKAAPMPATKSPPPVQQQELPTVTANRGAREQDKAPPEKLHQEARKQATSGACTEALTIRDRIARVDPGYFNKNVAGDAEINRCVEQQRRNKADSKRPASPSRMDEAEKKVDDKASKDAAH